MADGEANIESPCGDDIPQNQHLEKVLQDRKRTRQEELRHIEAKGTVREALDLDDEVWAKIFVNLSEKVTALEGASKKIKRGNSKSNILGLSSSRHKSSSGVVGWKGILSESKTRDVMARQQKELDDLERQKLVLKSLQDRKRFENAAVALFGQNVPRLQITKKCSANVLVSELTTEDDEIDPELQSKVKHKTQSLVGVVFSAPSSRMRKHQQLIHQVRLGEKRTGHHRHHNHHKTNLSKSADHSITLTNNTTTTTSDDDELESSGRFNVGNEKTDSSTNSSKKWRKKVQRKYNTLPYIRKKSESKKNNSADKSSQRRLDNLKNKLLLKSANDTVEEEVSEVESVASVSTLTGHSPRMERRHISNTASPLSEPPSKNAFADSEMDPIVIDSKRKISEDNKKDEKKEAAFSSMATFQLQNVKQQETNAKYSKEHLLQTSQVHPLAPSSVHTASPQITPEDQSSSSTVSKSIDIEQEELVPGPVRMVSDSSTTSSASHTTTDSLPNSSIKSSDGEELEIESSIHLLQELKSSEDMKIPSVPPVNGSSTSLFALNTPDSWLEKYNNGHLLERERFTSQTSMSDDDDLSLSYSDVAFSSVTSDPGFTPFLMSDVHPLGTDYSAINPRWKGNLVLQKAWEDPGFREYSNELDHEPTNEDIVNYKLVLLSKELETKFENKLALVLGEALILAMKDQLSYVTFEKLSHKLSLQANSIRDGTVLVALLGRSLWEKLPKLQETIVEYTQRAIEECYVYSTILDVGAPTDFSEFRSDYDDWDEIESSEDMRKTILLENAPFLLSPTDNSPPLCVYETTQGDENLMHLPQFPPKPQQYEKYLMLPRPKITRSKSVEVLFIETIEASDANQETTVPIATDLNESMIGQPTKFQVPRRTMSESSMFENPDTRRSSMCSSVFESITEERAVHTRGDQQVCNGRTAGSNDKEDESVIKAGSRDEAWRHLKHVESRGGTLPRPIVLSTSSTESTSIRKTSIKHPTPLLSRNSSHDSTASLGSTTSSSTSNGFSDIDWSSTGSGNQSPTKHRRISGMASAMFDKIAEESTITSTEIVSSFETAETVSGTSELTHVDVAYSHITMIKPLPPARNSSELDSADDQNDDQEQSDDAKETENDEDGGKRADSNRRRSSIDVLMDVATPVLTLGIPIAALTVVYLAFK